MSNSFLAFFHLLIDFYSDILVMEVAKAALVPTVPTSPVSTPPSTQILQTTDQPGSERPLLSDTPPCQDSPADFCKIFS